MPTCLLSLGSNVGDREAMLREALANIEALPDVSLMRQSRFHRSRPLGGPAGQQEFVNAAAQIETTVPPTRLLAELKAIETRQGRTPAERWAPRTLDIDLLLYANEVMETATLTLPHPRMTFRRFVLEPAAQIAPRTIHPIVGWPLERLLLHLDSASDLAALLSPAPALRDRAGAMLAAKFGAKQVDPPGFTTSAQLWPPALAAWFALPAAPAVPRPVVGRRRRPPYAAAAFPKLTILLDPPAPNEGRSRADWSAVVRRPGRGPTLRLPSAQSSSDDADIFAAIESVWPDLGRSNTDRLE